MPKIKILSIESYSAVAAEDRCAHNKKIQIVIIGSEKEQDGMAN